MTYSSRNVTKVEKEERKNKDSKTSLYRIHKRVHPELAISSKAIGVMNSIVNHLFHKLAAEASRLSHKGDPVWTLSTDNVQMAVRLMLPGNLCKNAIDAGTKALALHSVSDSGSITDESQSTLGNLPEAVRIWWEDPGTSEECNTDGTSITDDQNLRCILTAGLPAGKVKTKKS
ncbi:core histone h2A/H2B/H3/H4 domain-containing protein [Ditylenchus destructor]|nr:core histone h2A/H2B/H3/H4 domain-containing protein [Ditylenchus destructor]